MKSCEFSLTRWHKIAERLAAIANESAESAKNTFLNVSADGFAGAEQMSSLENQNKEAENFLQKHLVAWEGITNIRSILAIKNAQLGISEIVSKQEAANRRMKLIKEILNGQKTEMVPLKSLESYKPFGEPIQKNYYRRGEERGAISVRTLSTEQEEKLKKEAEILQNTIYNLVDSANDLNKEKVSIELKEEVARLAGLLI